MANYRTTFTPPNSSEEVRAMLSQRYSIPIGVTRLGVGPQAMRQKVVPRDSLMPAGVTQLGVRKEKMRCLQTLATAVMRKKENDDRKERMALLRKGDSEAYKRKLAESSHNRYAELMKQTETIIASLGLVSEDLPPSQPTQPTSFKTLTLQPYQLEGVAWLYANSVKKVNSILADEMGLGKTAQTIALFCRMLEDGDLTNARFLVLAPLSTLDNWMAELGRCAPHLKCLKFHGSREERWNLCKAVSSHDVVVAQYASLQHPALKDMKTALQSQQWTALVVDEGHRLKNAAATFSQNVRLIKAKNRLLLTGTPLQNELQELWSLLNFLMPDTFKNPESFDSWFGLSDKKAQSEPTSDEEKLLLTHRLHSLLRPFMLRREKKDVLLKLPSKREVIVKAPLTDLQLSLYKQVQEHNVVGWMVAPPSTEGAYTPPPRLGGNLHMSLRRVCLHPLLLFSGQDIPDSVYYSLLLAGSGKAQILNKILQRLFCSDVECRHKCLIFTQFASVLDMLEDIFSHLYHWTKQREYERLDGCTSCDDRDAAMRRFQDKSNQHSKVFILSTRAGGQGINLQEADTVLFYDMDWNPQQDLQAMSRAHRLGQQRDVLVIKLQTDAPVEQHMLGVTDAKLEKEALAIQAGMYDQKSTALMRDEKIREVIVRPPSTDTQDGLSDAELNKLLARGDEELQLYERLSAVEGDKVKPEEGTTSAPMEGKVEEEEEKEKTSLPEGFAQRQEEAVAHHKQRCLSLEETAAVTLGPRKAALRCNFEKYDNRSSDDSSTEDGGSESS